MFVYGRCRSGRRWFWVAGDYEMFFGDRYEYGWAEADAEAIEAAQKAVERLAGDQTPVVHCHHGWAFHRLKRLNAEKRRVRPTARTASTNVVEYLYGGGYYDGESYVVSFRIAKKTAKRIYYVRRDGSQYEDAKVGIVNRQKLETDGEVYNYGVHWSSADYHHYLKPPEVKSNRESELDLHQLKRLMADAHPDRGGSSQAFIAARKRYVEAKRYQEAS